MDIAQISSDKIKESFENGYFDKVVTETIQKTVKDITESVFKSYGDWGKALEKHIKDAIGISFENISLDAYNKIVCDIVEKELYGTIHASASEVIKKTIADTIQVLDKSEWKLSEVMKLFMDRSVEFNDRKPISFHIGFYEWGTWHISFDESPNKDEGRCRYKLLINDKGELWMYNIDNKRVDILSDSIHGHFDKFIFNLYATNATVIVDEDATSETVNYYFED